MQRSKKTIQCANKRLINLEAFANSSSHTVFFLFLLCPQNKPTNFWQSNHGYTKPTRKQKGKFNLQDTFKQLFVWSKDLIHVYSKPHLWLDKGFQGTHVVFALVCLTSYYSLQQRTRAQTTPLYNRIQNIFEFFPTQSFLLLKMPHL